MTSCWGSRHRRNIGRLRSLYLGCTIGRVANRIRDARFTLDGVTYELTANEPPNHLHGGGDLSLGERSWSIDEPARPDSVTFRLVSDDLEEGYPGVLRVAVTYTLTDGNELVIDFLAGAGPAHSGRSDASLLLEPGRPPVASRHPRPRAVGRRFDYAPTDEGRVPTGLIVPVAQTPLDFRVPTPVGARIGRLRDLPVHGYDHALVLDGDAPSKSEPRPAARLRDPITGRVMELSTTEPALQLYSGQGLPEMIGKHGARYMPFAGHRAGARGDPECRQRAQVPVRDRRAGGSLPAAVGLPVLRRLTTGAAGRAAPAWTDHGRSTTGTPS